MQKVQLRGKCAPSYNANLYCVCICVFVWLCICTVVFVFVFWYVFVFAYLCFVFVLFIRKVPLWGKCPPPSNADLYWLYLNPSPSLSTPGSDFVGCTLIRVLLYRPYPTFPSGNPHPLILLCWSMLYFYRLFPTHYLSDIVVFLSVLLHCPDLIQDFTAAMEPICLLFHTLCLRVNTIKSF